MARWTAGHGRRRPSPSPWPFRARVRADVTPRSTAAVEAAGRRAFGIASSVVTVARMIGMAVGLAILTAYGSTTIDRLSAEVYATPDAYLEFIPEELRDRPLRDPLVVEALEAWASREAASIMVGLFLVAAVVTVGAVPPALALGGADGAAARDGRRARRRGAYADRRWPPRSPTSSSERPTGRRRRADDPAPTPRRRRGAPGPGPRRRGRRPAP